MSDLPAPMLAKSVEKVPEGDLLYEPKWDGFRGIVQVGADGVEIGSRGEKPLTRYFPELVDAFSRLLPPCVLDGEIVVTLETDGVRRLQWDALTQRIQPGYDHSYFFVSTFMADHVAWHAERLR